MEFRMAQPDDIQGIIDLSNLVFRSGEGEIPNMGTNFPLFLLADNAENLAIAVDDGKVVSHFGTMISSVMVYGHAIKIASVGAVCTHPDYRGRGIASSLQNMALKHLAARDIPIVTISGGRGLYTRNGAIPTGGETEYYFEPSLIGVDNNLEILVYTGADDAKDFAYAYHNESVRYHRTIDEFPILIKAMPSISTNNAATTYAVLCDNTVTAYISGLVKDGTFDIIEYAGVRSQVLELLGSTKDNCNVSKVKIRVPFYDLLLQSLLSNKNLEGVEQYMSGTIRLVDASLLWQNVLPIYDEILGVGSMPKSWTELDLSDVDGDTLDIKLVNFVFTHLNRTWKGSAIPLPDPVGYNYI